MVYCILYPSRAKPCHGRAVNIILQGLDKNKRWVIIILIIYIFLFFLNFSMLMLTFIARFFCAPFWCYHYFFLDFFILKFLPLFHILNFFQINFIHYFIYFFKIFPIFSQPSYQPKLVLYTNYYFFIINVKISNLSNNSNNHMSKSF